MIKLPKFLLTADSSNSRAVNVLESPILIHLDCGLRWLGARIHGNQRKGGTLSAAGTLARGR